MLVSEGLTKRQLWLSLLSLSQSSQPQTGQRFRAQDRTHSENMSAPPSYENSQAAYPGDGSGGV